MGSGINYFNILKRFMQFVLNEFYKLEIISILKPFDDIYKKRAVIVVIINLIVDVLYHFIDPRIRIHEDSR